VTQGFVGATTDGRITTLGRGGSDYTASLLGAALDADRVEIWTDVDGIMTADPRIVPNALVLPVASHSEAAELATFGAKVLHPATQVPLVEARIPCVVLNSFAPEKPGTTVVSGVRPAAIGGSPVRSISWKKGVTVVNVRAAEMQGAVGFLRRLFEIIERHDAVVDVIATSEINISFTLEGGGALRSIVADLGRLGEVTVYERRAIVAVVGVGLRGTKGLSGRLFTAMTPINVEIISQGASEINVTLVVREEDGPEAVRLLHHEFFGGG
jgi:aspartate kinase